MADQKISALSAAAALVGTEAIPIVQSSATVRTTPQAIVASPLGFNNQTGTTYTLALTDAGLIVELNNGSAITLTVDTNANVAFPIGTVILLWQQGAGQVTIAPAGGVTIRSFGAKLKLTGQYSSATATKRGTNEWFILGDLTA